MVLKKIFMASLAASVLTLHASTAFAATGGECGFVSVQHDDVTTPQSYSGVAYGYAIDDTGAWVSIRCYVTVNDQEVPSADFVGAGTRVAVAFGTISFDAADGASIKLCTEINGVTVGCGESTNTQIPPQEVLDAIDSMFQAIADATAGLDPILCGALRTSRLMQVANIYVPGTFDLDDCDLYVGAERVIDFVPYDD